MINDKEFIEQLIEKGLVLYKSKRQLAFALGLPNAQTLNHWIKRGKVPGNLKPAIAETLGIDWLTKEADQPIEVSCTKNHIYSEWNEEALDFAVMGIIEYAKEYPKTMADPAWRKRAFKILYKAWYNEEMRRLGVVPLLNLVA
tara:strand:- start:55 stop:483 length:429 start_codon:yes stop_codon:yes gene_type:complete